MAVLVALVVVAGVAGRWPGRARPKLTVDPLASPAPADGGGAGLPIGLGATQGPHAQVVERDVGTGPELPGAPGLEVVAVDDFSRLQHIDLASGDRRRVALQLPPTGASDAGVETMFDVGSTMVLQADDAVVALRPDGSTTILATGHRVVPTVADDTVWVTDQIAGPRPATVSRLHLDGTPQEAVRLPALASAVAGTADTLIVSTPTQTVAIRPYGIRTPVAAGATIASDGTNVAWMSCTADLICAIVMGTVGDPDRSRLRLPPAEAPADDTARTARFSPDGRWLAVPLRHFDAASGAPRTEIAIVDTRTGLEQQRIVAAQQDLQVPLAWSPDSRWLAVAAFRRTHLWSAQRHEDHIVDLDVRPARGLLLRAR